MTTAEQIHDLDQITPHEETREFRYFGPPGTGKTTMLGRQIERAAARFGIHRILVTSFSRAAAAELVGRGLSVPSQQIGTLHAHCWRALHGPRLAQDLADDWNLEHPSLAISKGKHGRLDGGADEMSATQPGDLILQEVDRYRGLKVPYGDLWIPEARRFHDAWTAFKLERNVLDFTDLIETALHKHPIAPGDPAVIFVDEAQDLNPLEMELIRQWGRHTEYFIVAGDDDQLLYSFCGCKAATLLSPLPESSIRVLAQSYRIPRAVHRVATAWISKVRDRQPKSYQPRDVEGAVKLAPMTYKGNTDALVHSIVAPHLDAGESVMILGSCSYMLHPVIASLRRIGIPYHNPYRAKNGFWNPLRRTPGSASSRVLSLLAVHPDYEDARRWRLGDLRLLAEWMDGTYLQRGAKTKLLKRPVEELSAPAEPRDLIETFQPHILDLLLMALDGSPEDLLTWWAKALREGDAKRSEFPLRIATERGRATLEAPPAVIVGTIHSVKGGEADNVILFPDLSERGWEHAFTPEGLDDTRRVFYVGMTRARQTLYLAKNVSDLAVSWAGLPL